MEGVTHNPARALIWATVGFFVGFAAVSLYGPAVKSFKDLLHLSSVEVGFLVSIPNLTGSLLRIPFGAWVDKVGGKKPMLTLLILSIIGMGGLTFLLLNYYPERITREFYPLILSLGILSGCGIATFSVGIGQVSYCYPRAKQGTALGIYAGVGNTAPGIFAILLPFVITTWGLSKAYFAWFVFLVAGTFLYAIFSIDAPYFQLIKRQVPLEQAKDIAKKMGQEMIPTGKLLSALSRSAKNLNNWLLVFLYAVCFGSGFLGLTAWLPAYWTFYHKLSAISSGILTAVAFSLLASFVRVGGG
jgi:NNP family nitrate/nitrite transporter-like MFS transporter